MSLGCQSARRRHFRYGCGGGGGGGGVVGGVELVMTRNINGKKMRIVTPFMFSNMRGSWRDSEKCLCDSLHLYNETINILSVRSIGCVTVCYL